MTAAEKTLCFAVTLFLVTLAWVEIGILSLIY
jgi:hypothetical protein